MNDEYELFDIELESISPIHIGSGDFYSQLDYISDGKKVFTLDFNRILENVAKESIDDLTNDILKNFKNNIWEGKVGDFFENYGINWQNFIEREYDLIGKIGKNEIRRFIFTGNGAYIPGSSIKGAIKTAVLFKILNNNANIRERIIDTLKQNWNDKEINKLISPNPFRDLFRAFQVSDTQPVEDIKIAGSKVYHFERKKFDTSIVYEVADGILTKATVKIDKKLLETNQLKKDNFDLTKENIINVCNDFSKEIINYELERLANTDDEKILEIKGFYKYLEKEVKNLEQNQCLLRIGQGSSSIAMTMFLVLKYDKQIKQKFIMKISNREKIHFVKDKNGVWRYNGQKLIIDRKSKNKPLAGETWYCKTKKRGANKIVNPVIKEESAIFFPATAKFINESKEVAIKPLGWVKLKLIDK